MTDSYRILNNEKMIFARIAEGNEEAFAQVFHHYNRRLYPFILKMIKSESAAEEIVQEVFLKLWTRRQTLTAIKNYQSFIFTVAANATLDHMRKIAIESRKLKELIAPIKNSNQIEEWFDGKEAERLFMEAMKALPPQRQLVYRLSRNEGKSYKEIGRELNISTKTVQAHLVEANRFIREYFHKVPGASIAILLLVTGYWIPVIIS